MRRLKVTGKFKKSIKLAKKRGLDISLINSIVDKLIKGEQLDKKYLDHELKGNYKGLRECHILPDWLLVYMIEDDILTLT